MALVMGNMIGVGVFLLPAQLAAYGWNALIGWVVTIAGGTMVAAVFARLAAPMPVTGGPYVYAREAFGPLPAFVVAWSYWVSLSVGNATIATGAVSYLSALAPPLAEPAWAAAATVAVVWLLTLVNCRGVQAAGIVQLVTTALKLLPLLAVIGLAAALIAADGGASLRPFHAADISLGAVTVVATLTLWPMLGLKSATVPAGDVRDAGRTIPRATLIGTIATGVLYLFLSSALVLLMPPDVLGRSSAPVAAFVRPVTGRSGGAGAGRLRGDQRARLPQRLDPGAGAVAVRPCTRRHLSALVRGDGAKRRAGPGARLHQPAADRDRAAQRQSLDGGAVRLPPPDLHVLVARDVSRRGAGRAAAEAERAPRHGGGHDPAAAAIAVVYAAWALTGAGVEASLWCALLLASGIPVYFLGRWRSAPAAQPAEVASGRRGFPARRRGPGRRSRRRPDACRRRTCRAP